MSNESQTAVTRIFPLGRNPVKLMSKYIADTNTMIETAK